MLDEQLVQADDDAEEYVIDGQLAQTLADDDAEYVPAGQLKQLVAPVEL